MGKSILAVVILIACCARAPAQSGEESWDRLRQLRPGQRIEVADWKSKSARGRFSGYADQAIRLRVNRNEISIPRAEVFSVKSRRGLSRGRKVLAGLAMGAAAGLAVGLLRGATYHESGETGVFVLVWTPVGAGIGAAVGGILPSGETTVYRAGTGNRLNR